MPSLRLSPSSKHVASVGVQFFQREEGRLVEGDRLNHTLGEFFCHTNGSVLRSVGVRLQSGCL